MKAAPARIEAPHEICGRTYNTTQWTDRRALALCQANPWRWLLSLAKLMDSYRSAGLAGECDWRAPVVAALFVGRLAAGRLIGSRHAPNRMHASAGLAGRPVGGPTRPCVVAPNLNNCAHGGPEPQTKPIYRYRRCQIGHRCGWLAGGQFGAQLVVRRPQLARQTRLDLHWPAAERMNLSARAQ